MITWIENLSAWDGSIPAAFVAADVAPAGRAALPQALVTGALGIAPAAVRVEQSEGRRPVVKEPIGSGLCLSTSSRGPFTAVAVAASQVGVDVELVDPDGEVPWNVLHPNEATMLREQDRQNRALVLARLWSLKEAYLKALGIGLFREPSTFAVSFADAAGARFDDPLAPARVAEADTVWRNAGSALVAVSTVVLARPRGTLAGAAARARNSR